MTVVKGIFIFAVACFERSAMADIYIYIQLLSVSAVPSSFLNLILEILIRFWSFTIDVKMSMWSSFAVRRVATNT